MSGGEPAPDAVATAVESRLSQSVESVTVYEEGMNAVYRVSLEGGSAVVLKAGTRTQGSKLLSGPVLIERINQETDLPVPEVLAIVPNGDEHIGCTYFVMDHIDGRRETDVHAFSERAHEQLTREAGRHLATMHSVSYEGPYGRLQAENGSFFVEHPFERWADYVVSVTGYHAEHIDDRLANLRPIFEDGMAKFDINEREVEKSILYRDYHPKNLVFDPHDNADPFVRAMLDFNFRPVGDTLLDVAVAEVHLVDLPVGKTPRADPLRDTLRDAYADARGGRCTDYFDERYPYYRLLAIGDYLNHVDYAVQLCWEDDDERVVERLQTFVRTRCAEIESN